MDPDRERERVGLGTLNFYTSSPDLCGIEHLQYNIYQYFILEIVE